MPCLSWAYVFTRYNFAFTSHYCKDDHDRQAPDALPPASAEKIRLPAARPRAGDPAQLAKAIWNYNHSDSYVAEVLELATSYGVATLGGGLANAAPSDLLNNPRVSLTSNARADLEAGIVDSRIVALLDAISRRYEIGVGVFKTGHSMLTRSGSISNHYYGRAADITFINGSPVSKVNLTARQIVTALAEIRGDLRPDEIGHPFFDLTVVGGFSDSDHDGHIHIGFDSQP